MEILPFKLSLPGTSFYMVSFAAVVTLLLYACTSLSGNFSIAHWVFLPFKRCGKSNLLVIKIGRHEYEQMEYIWNNQSHRKKCIDLYGKTPLHRLTGTYNEYNVVYIRGKIKYNVSAIIWNEKSYFMTIKIDERVNGTTSHGGSNFRVEMHGEDNEVCTAQDYTNGTYLVICPVLHSCVNITIQLKYINFDAYLLAKLAPANIPIARKKWCPPKTFLQINSMHCGTEPSGGDEISNGRWRHVNNTWQWVEKGRAIELLSKNKSKSCIDSARSIHIVGDSHTRYIAYYLIHMKSGILPSNLQKRGSFNKYGIYFWWTTYVREMVNNLNTLRFSDHRKRNKTREDYLLLSTGAWDTAYIGLKQFIISFNESFIPALKQFMQDPVWSNTTIIYMNVSPSPPQRHFVEAAGYRTNFGLAAVNYWVGRKMRKLGIPVVDAFNVIHLRNNENVCNNHYICYNKELGQPTVRQLGTVGYKVADIIIRFFCGKK